MSTRPLYIGGEQTGVGRSAPWLDPRMVLADRSVVAPFRTPVELFIILALCSPPFFSFSCKKRQQDAPFVF